MAGVYELHRSLQPEEIEKLQADLQAELARGLAHGSVGGDELEAQSEPTTQMSSRHSGPTTQLSSRRAALKVEAVADFESVLTPVHGLPTRLELAGLGDVDEIRCSVFRSRRLQRRQKHCWMEKAFVGWDWASSARKTRECLSSRCSQQRKRRRAAPPRAAAKPPLPRRAAKPSRDPLVPSGPPAAHPHGQPAPSDGGPAEGAEQRRCVGPGRSGRSPALAPENARTIAETHASCPPAWVLKPDSTRSHDRPSIGKVFVWKTAAKCT
jgi:hypothetical protein